MLDKNGSTPLHAQLRDTLRSGIVGGRLSAGSQLPSERELCEAYGVSRVTVRQALSQLLQERLIYRSVGKGTYVAGPRLQEELRPLSSFTEDMQRRGMVASSEVIAAIAVPADERLSTKLAAPRGSQLAYLHRIRLGDGQPICLQHTWVPLRFCPDLLQHDLARESLFAVLRSSRLKLVRAETEIEAALAGPEEARLLRLASPAAVLISEQTAYLDTGDAVEFTRSIFRADRYVLHTRTN